MGVTIATWVKVKSVTGSNINEIFVTEAPGITDPTKQGQYHFEIVDKGKVRFFQRNKDKTVYGRTTIEGIPENKWVHLAGNYNPNTKQATIYINGRPVKAYDQTEPQQTESLSTDWSKAAYIGAFKDDQGPPRQFKGALDEFYIFPCALPDDQIVTLKDTHRMRKFLNFSISYLNFVSIARRNQFKDNWRLLDCGQADPPARNEIDSSLSIKGEEFSNDISL